MINKRITVLAPSFALMSNAAIASALARIAAEFPEKSASLIQMLITLPSLIAIPMILFSGRLALVFTKKKIMITFLGCMCAGGIMPLVFHADFFSLLFAAVIFGIGFGGISPITTALINEHFSREQQGPMLGFQSAVIGVGGVFFGFLGGYLASVKWWYFYFSYLLLLIVIIISLGLPRGTVDVKTEKANFSFNRNLLFYLVQAIVCSCAVNVFNLNIAMLIKETGLGDSRIAGIVTSMFSAVCIVSGILTGQVIRRVKKYTIPLICGSAGMGLFIIYLSSALGMIMLGTFFVGAVYSIRMPAGYLKATQSVNASDATIAIALYCSANQMGQFLTPVVVNRFSLHFDETVAARYLSASLVLAVLCILSIVKELKTRGDL
jgi:MFS family permease